MITMHENFEYQVVSIKTLIWLGIWVSDRDERLPDMNVLLDVLELQSFQVRRSP